MALLSASDFIGYSDSFAAPAGFNDPIFAGSVDLFLSTGITQQVFDSLSLLQNALITWKLITYTVYHPMKMLLFLS